ncbi:MAG: DUF455 family protein [Bdellovibrionota bacterium]|nr:DUF455 family protein [Bdellovibrionota bacterium]
MNLKEYARQILEGGSLEDKLLDINPLIEEKSSPINFKIPSSPSREGVIAFSNKQIRFPKVSSFHLREKRAMALHFFANHELLAIEMMAAFLLYFPDDKENLKLKKGVLSSLKDEQKHLRMYLKRMKDLDGLELGGYPLNDFFWRQMKELNSPEKFLSFMSLTIEAANLDFAIYYKEVFDRLGDVDSSNLMGIILKDEIKHVGLGYYWLNFWSRDNNLWEYYKSLLPEKVTPARAKGMIFNASARLKAGMDEEFIRNVENYRDDFLVTDRKKWKFKNENGLHL